MVKEQEKASIDSEVERRNFRAWVAHQALYRIGWQFKMEATMLAGLVSFLAPSAAIIGIFSTANALGRSVGPLFATPWVDRSPSKKRCLLWLWACAVLCWATGTLYLWLPMANNKGRTLWWFFVCYALFFTFLGCVGIAQGALLGKIIPAVRRGSALSFTHTFSGPISLVGILIVYALVRPEALSQIHPSLGRLATGLVHPGAFPAPRNYALSFTVTTLLFTLAGVAVAFTREMPSRDFAQVSLRSRLKDASRLIRTNRDFRLLLWLQLLMQVGGTCLAFYTAYGRKAGGIDEANVILATLLQVFFQSVASSWLGRVADRKGNRVLIIWLTWVEAFTPVAAVLMATLFPNTSAYLLVYCLVGIRFPVFQLLVNYLLEIVPQEDHALALGTINLRLIATVPVPLLFGTLIDHAGYAVAMLGAATLIAASAVMSFFLREPRAMAKGAIAGRAQRSKILPVR